MTADDTARAEARESLQWADDAFADDLDPQLRIRRSSLRALLASTEAQPPTEPTDAEVARLFHEAYERLAPAFDYKTREASAVPWADVPANNKALMSAVAGEVRLALAAPPTEPTDAERIWDEAYSAGALYGVGPLAIDNPYAAHRTQEGPKR